MEPAMPDTNEERMKITHGYDHQHVVGEIFLSREIIGAVASGHRFELCIEYRGIEPIGVSLMPMVTMPNNLTNDPIVNTDISHKADPDDSRTWRCKKCDAYHTNAGWWKCCPLHTDRDDKTDVVCGPCAYELHPEFQH
jgi:hypothetical protein